VQPLPQRQIAPQRQPGRRVSLFFLDISVSFVEADSLSAFRLMTHGLSIHYTRVRSIY